MIFVSVVKAYLQLYTAVAVSPAVGELCSSAAAPQLLRDTAAWLFDWRRRATILFQSGPLAPGQQSSQSNAFITSFLHFYPTTRTSQHHRYVRKKLWPGRCANWKTEQQLIVMSTHKKSTWIKCKIYRPSAGQRTRHFLYTCEWLYSCVFIVRVLFMTCSLGWNTARKLKMF